MIEIGGGTPLGEIVGIEDVGEVGIEIEVVGVEEVVVEIEIEVGIEGEIAEEGKVVGREEERKIREVLAVLLVGLAAVLLVGLVVVLLIDQ